MEVKSRGSAQKMKKKAPDGKITRLSKPCPFCGTPVLSDVSHQGVRFFSCGYCGAKTSFQYSDELEALELWENRVEVK